MKEKAQLRSKKRRGSARDAKGRERAGPATVEPRGGVGVVCAVAIVASIAGILNAFTQDDVSILVDSARLHGFGALREILTLPYWPPPAAPDLYRPVASVLLAAQYASGDGAPFVFRIVSYALYALASVGVYRLALRLVPASIALFVAVVFAAHPVHVEAVALAVTQNELIVGALAAFMTVLYLDRRRSESGALSARDWAMLGVGYAIAGFSKEQGLLIPAFLILAEMFLAPSRALGERVRQLWRGFALLIAIAAGMIAVRTLVLERCRRADDDRRGVARADDGRALADDAPDRAAVGASSRVAGAFAGRVLAARIRRVDVVRRRGSNRTRDRRPRPACRSGSPASVHPRCRSASRGVASRFSP